MNVRTFLKWICPALLLFGGAAATAQMEEAVESFLPVVNTVTLQKSEYQKTVSGTGYIYYLEIEDKWYSRITINESDINDVRTGQNAALNGAAIGDGKYTGVVDSISQIAKQITAHGYTETVVEVIIHITNPDDNLRSGYTVTGDIAIGEPREVCVIPYAVICQDDEGEYVYVLQGSKAVRRNITTGEEFSDGAEVLSGLRETDEIITSPDTIEMSGALVKKEE